MEAVHWDAVIAALVSVWFFASAGYASVVAIGALRTGRYAPELGLDVHGWGASVAGWVTLVVAAALFAAGLLVSWVAAFG